MSGTTGAGGWARRPLFWIVVLVVFALGVGYLYRPQGQASEDVRRSYFRTTPDGVAALARGIDRLGRATAPRTTPLADADPVRGTIVLLQPRAFPSPREVRGLLDRLRDGGTLVYIPPYLTTGGGGTAKSPLMDSLGIRFRLFSLADQIREQTLEEPRWHEHALTAGLDPPGSFVHGLRIDGEDYPDSTGVHDVRRLLTAEDPGSSGWEWIVAAEFGFGEGRVVIFSEGGPVSNEQAGGHPLAVLAVRAALAYTNEADTVFFDEFHQGIRGDRTRAEVLRDFFLGSPGGRTLLHLVAVGFLVLACLGLRFGAPFPAVAPPDLERRSPLEHVSALGDLYRKAGAGNTAALLLVARLARTTRNPPPRTTADADALLRRLDVGVGANTPLARARRGLVVSPPDLAAVAAGIDEYLAARG
ncbi:MAG: DUF4350 domain-containing protein [Gemmatimonadota bacterium]|nr:DUF4350 domain-containing protein [Gemmatimonadota bacterium]MDE2985709.1 DUF4350 domain-containing protein [Gemmatimonadota bacterium]